MTAEDQYRELLCKFDKGIYVIETIEITHPLFTQDYYFTREPQGITATTEDEVEIDFVGTNIEIVANTKKSDLDANFSFTMADPNNYLDDELDRISLEDTDKIALIYRTYSSDNLDEPAFYFRLSVFDVSQQKGFFTLTAGADMLNYSKTGEIYDYERFPMLRAL